MASDTRALKRTAVAMGLAAGAYAGYVGAAWLRYGQTAPPDARDTDALLDRMMPLYDVVERHHIEVAAPADVTFAAACELDLMSTSVSRAIFKTREIVLGS